MNTTKAAIGAVSEQNFIQLGISVFAIFLENNCSRIQIILCVVYCIIYIMIPLYNTYIFEYNIGYIESVIREKWRREMNEKEKHYIFFIFKQWAEGRSPNCVFWRSHRKFS